MFKSQCSVTNCASPSWGKSQDGGAKCFKHLMEEVRESGFADRLEQLAGACGSPEQLAQAMRIDCRMIGFALDGRPTDIHKVIMAAKRTFGKQMRDWLFEGGHFPGLPEHQAPGRGPTAELAQIIYEMADQAGRTAVIVFSVCDGTKTFAECRTEISGVLPKTYDDWMFLAAVGSEIKRISEAQCSPCACRL